MSSRRPPARLTSAWRPSAAGSSSSSAASRPSRSVCGAVEEPGAAAPPPSAPAPEARPAPSTYSAYTLAQLEHLVAAAARDTPERADEWTAYLFFLRDHAEPDGRLPARFDALVADVFADVL
jgi:hypothetical protein